MPHPARRRGRSVLPRHGAAAWVAPVAGVAGLVLAFGWHISVGAKTIPLATVAEESSSGSSISLRRR
ncbi:MAG: hypothetical protein ACOCYV_03220 [Planctomycetota bacterium]